MSEFVSKALGQVTYFQKTLYFSQKPTIYYTKGLFRLPA